MSKGRVQVAQSNKLYKNNPSDVIWWVDNEDEVKGEWIFTFDRKQYFNLFSDYPHKLTAEQKRTFDKENPYWKEFFQDER
jgi:hypothetical protein